MRFKMYESHFANTLAPTPFPLRIGAIYGLGLFWCKGYDILSEEDPLLTTASYSSGVDAGVHLLRSK